MAFFKFRKGGDDNVRAAVPLESVDAMRRRAMHRLIGAVVLVVAGVIGFPMLFDNQPRPIAVDIPIEIPDKTKSRPIVLPAAAPTPEAPAVVAAAPAPATAPIAPPVVASKEPTADSKPGEKALEKAVEKAVLAPAKKSSEPARPANTSAPKSATQVAAQPAIQPDATAEAAKAKALLEGRATALPEAAAPSSEGRFVVQVGAFADAAKAKEARTRLERAGLKTYTQVVETKDGPRTRVRVGPFSDKAQAEMSASKIKTLDLPASILVL